MLNPDGPESIGEVLWCAGATFFVEAIVVSLAGFIPHGVAGPYPEIAVHVSMALSSLSALFSAVGFFFEFARTKRSCK